MKTLRWMKKKQQLLENLQRRSTSDLINLLWRDENKS
jgi:hypothetical protein